MVKTKQFINPGSIILLFVLVWMIAGNIKLKQEMAVLDDRNVSLVQDSTAFVKTVNQLGDSIVEQQQLVMSERMAKELVSAEFDEFKSLQSQVKTNTRIEIREVRIPVPVEVEVIKIDSTDYMKLPATFQYAKPKLQFSVGVDRSGLTLNELSIQNTTTVTIGKKKKGFLKRPEPVIEIKHSSPYVQTYGVNNVVIDNPTPWYSSTLFKVGVGFALGVAVTR